MGSLFKAQVVRFLFVGLSTVCIDFLSYFLLTSLLCPAPLAKAGGFITGTLFAFFANRRFVFASKKSGRFLFVQFLLLYGTSLALNVSLNQLLLTYNYAIAFLLATGTSATLNWLGMKWWVFSPKSVPHE